MEVLSIQLVSAFLYCALLVYLLVQKTRTDKLLILAVALGLGWNVYGVANNWMRDIYILNPYVNLSMYTGWLIYLQSLYVSIPGISKGWRINVYIVDGFLVGALIFHFSLNAISGIVNFDGSSLTLIIFLVSIALLFYLENIVRYLKASLRYRCKHLFFILGVMSSLVLIDYYFRLSDGPKYYLQLLSIFIHLLVPVFIFISSYRLSEVAEKVAFDPIHSLDQVQYLMVFIGVGLLLAGILEFSYLYISGVDSEYINAAITIFTTGLVGIFVLSNGFRSFLSLMFRSYFYKDRNDYKKEWGNVNAITNAEEDVAEKILAYYINWSGALRGGIYVRRNHRFVLGAGINALETEYPCGFIEFFTKIDQFETIVFYLPSRTDNEYLLGIKLEVDGELVAICILPHKAPRLDMDESMVSLCETVSAAFAIKLRANQQKHIIRKQEKLAGFNKTIAFLAHDLKNIAAQQQLAVENFSTNKTNKDFLEDFNETINHSTSRLLEIIEQFKLNGDSSKSMNRSILIDQYVEIIRREIDKSGFLVKLKFNFGENEYYVDKRLVSILINLLKNSSEASPKDHTIFVTLTIEAGNFLMEVRDQGRGMSQEYIDEALFEPFVTEKGNLGLGIGMYQVKETIDELIGEISVQSELNKGTIVSVSVPLSK